MGSPVSTGMTVAPSHPTFAVSSRRRRGGSKRDTFLAKGDEMVTATPTYRQMAHDAQRIGANVVFVPLDKKHRIDLDNILKATSARTKLTSLVNPNNPVGTIVEKKKMDSFLKAVPRKAVVVVDEAYHDYVTNPDYESCVKYVLKGYPIIVIRTFSKVFGLAGARIGYSLATADLARRLASNHLFLSVGRPSLTAAAASLNDTDHIRKTVRLNIQAKRYLENQCKEMKLPYIKSATNFMMVYTRGNAIRITGDLSHRGFRVRSGWNMSRFLRISTGSMEEMKELSAALKEVI